MVRHYKSAMRLTWEEPSRPTFKNGVLARVLSLGGTLLILVGLLIALRNHLSIHAYRNLSRRVYVPISDSLAAAASNDDAAQERTIDWQSLWEINGDVAAWVRLEGTGIDLPVMRATQDDPEHYLSHDLWNRLAFEGIPFMDRRCKADGAHRLVYGHNLSMGGQFSELQRAYEQEVFDALGACHWDTPARGGTTLVPLCALKVDLWYEPIQTFSFEGEQGLRQWLASLVHDAEARAEGHEHLLEHASSAITLVTCSSNLGNQRWRTMVVFVEQEGGQMGGV